MNDESHDPHVRERFYRRERRSVPAAREFTEQALRAWGFAERADDVVLCVSELATNALLHGVPPGRGFLLCLRRDPSGGVLRVEVHDSGDGHAEMAEAAAAAVGHLSPAADAESGRGLVLVDALADKWDVGERLPGKVVWCEFAVR